MDMKNIIKWLGVSVLALSACGCSDFLNLTSSNNMSNTKVWSDAKLAKEAVNGVYNVFYERWCYGGGDSYREAFEAYSSVMDNDLNWRENIIVCHTNANPSNYVFRNNYKYFYTFIFRANDVISHIDQVPNMSDAEKSRYKAEARFLRGFAYFYMNVLWRGVPLYLEFIEDPSTATKKRATEQEVWDFILDDFTACIENPDLPERFSAGDSNYGRITKGAAYAYRGQVYQFLKKWDKALADFEKVGELGYDLYTADGAKSFSQLFKPKNKQCPEMIFSIQTTVQSGMGNPRAILYGSRVTAGSAWNNYLPNPAYVQSFENADGSKFDWEQYLPGWNSMTPKQRVVFFLRDGLTEDEKTRMSEYGADLSKYLPSGNEARVKKAYASRDPRLAMSIITPYATYKGYSSGVENVYTLRWPYRGSDSKEPFDIRTDTNDKFYYLWRKYVPEGNECITRWVYDEDIILCRYAEVLLRQAECLNELGNTADAVKLVNRVRSRAGQPGLNDPSYPATAVSGQDDLRERIRNEFYWELGGEDSMYFNELRWGTWLDKKFRDNTSAGNARGTNGLMQIWGETTYTWNYLGEHVTTWAIPAKEREMNPAIDQNPGWQD